MPPQRTNIHCIAHEAYEHIFAAAGALAFVNAYSGSAALSAPYNAFAERQRACPFLPLSHTLGDDA
jgi:hypothetical protein